MSKHAFTQFFFPAMYLAKQCRTNTW